MTDSGVPPRARIFVLSCLVLLVFIAAVAGDPAAAVAVSHAPPWLDHAARAVSILGLSGYMLFASAVVFIAASLALRRGRKRLFGSTPRLLAERAALFFVAIALSGILAQLVKHLVGRARPKLIPEFGAYHFDALSWKASLASFPSGHATTVFAAAVVMTLFVPRARIAWFAFALVIALARILSSAHYVSDVAAGAALGSFVALWLCRLFAERGMALPATAATPPVAWRTRRPTEGSAP